MNLTTIKAKLKGAVRSWTIWVNSAFATLILNLDVVQQVLPQLTPYLTPTQMALLVALVNLGLRFKTKTSLAAK